MAELSKQMFSQFDVLTKSLKEPAVGEMEDVDDVPSVSVGSNSITLKPVKLWWVVLM